MERGQGLVRPLRCLKKGKDPVLVSVEVVGEQDMQEVDADAEVDQEDDILLIETFTSAILHAAKIVAGIRTARMAHMFPQRYQLCQQNVCVDMATPSCG